MASIEEQIKDIKKRLDEAKGTPAEAIFQSVLTQLEYQLGLQKQGTKKTSKTQTKDVSKESFSRKSTISKDRKFSPRKPDKSSSLEKEEIVPSINYHYYSGAKIELLKLSPEIIDTMKQAELLTIADLLKTGKEKLQKIDNLDEKAVTEVATALKKQAKIDLDNYKIEVFNKKEQEKKNENLSETKNIKEAKTKESKTEEINPEATVKDTKVKQTKKQSKK